MYGRYAARLSFRDAIINHSRGHLKKTARQTGWRLRAPLFVAELAPETLPIGRSALSKERILPRMCQAGIGCRGSVQENCLRPLLQERAGWGQSCADQQQRARSWYGVVATANRRETIFGPAKTS